MNETKRAKRTGCIAALCACVILLTVGYVLPAVRDRASDADASVHRTAEDSMDGTCPDFSTLACENGSGESVFPVSVREFIACYNSVYRQDHDENCLTPPGTDNWYCFSDTTPCFGYPAFRCQFSEYSTVWPMPKLSIYASDGNELYEVRITFDDHSYQETFFQKFRDMSCCLLRTVCRDLTEEEIDALFHALCDLSSENFWGDHDRYEDPERPPLTAVYQYGDVGLYCFYGSGNIEICMFPLTAAAEENLQSKNTAILALRD